MKKAEAITLPAILGEEKGKIIRWHVNEGDRVAEGQLIANLEMGTMELDFESYLSGTVLYLGAKPHQEIRVGYLLVIIGEKGAEIDSIIRKSAQDYLSVQSARASMKGYLGEIKMFAGRHTPLSWHACNGQELRIDEFSELYEVLGTAYGNSRDGFFKLPRIESPNGVKTIICVKGEYPE